MFMNNCFHFEIKPHPALPATHLAYDLIHSRFHIEGSLYIQHLVTSGGTLNCEETF